MTIGIYSLHWEEEMSRVYIGQSQNIENRYKEHLRKIRNKNHSNYKIREMYLKYSSLPTLSILQVTSIEDLNTLEDVWTKEFNSIKEGLNIIEAGLVGYGSNSNSSKYSILQLLRVFRLVSSDNYLNNIEIAKLVKVDVSLVSDITKSSSHLWLKDKYPFRYSLMLARSNIRYSNRNCLATTNKLYNLQLPVVIDTEGNEYIVSNIRDFAKYHGLLNTHLGAVIRKQRKTHKGWKLKEV